MPNWTFYPAFIATAVSIVGLSHIALAKHTGQSPRTLSELAAAEQSLLARFRNILLFCGILFGITIYGFIVPGIGHPSGVAQMMAVGMLGLAFLFWAGLPRYMLPEILLAISLCMAGALTFWDKRRYLLYEMVFIFASHFTVLVAALALQ